MKEKQEKQIEVPTSRNFTQFYIKRDEFSTSTKNGNKVFVSDYLAIKRGGGK